MFPTLADLLPGAPPIDTHVFFVGLAAIVAGLIYWSEARRRGRIEDATIYVAVGGLAGAAIFMRLGTWAQHLNPAENASLAEQWAYGNRSILGALVGAWVGILATKAVLHYKVSTGDLFAPAIAAGLAIGRVGCLLTERPGTPTGSSFGIILNPTQAAHLNLPAGVPLHPSFVYEIAFHTVAFLLLWFWLRHLPLAPGETFVLYVGAYAIFRFCVEFVRGNEVVWAGLTRPQLFLAVSIPLLILRIVLQARRGHYRPLFVRPVGVTA